MGCVQDLITVIIPAYNSGEYIKFALTSLEMQSYANFEALIIDGSTDDTTNLIDEFVHYDHRFKSYKIQNLGPGFARNFGIDKAKGKYVTFMDHDDIAAENWLGELHAIATKEETDITFCSGFDFFGDTVSCLNLPLIPDTVYTLNDTIRNQISRFFIAPWLKLMPLEFITKNKLKFSLDNKFDDVLFHFCAMHAAKKIAFTEKRLYYHRIHDGSITSKSIANKNLFFYHYKTLYDLILYKHDKKLIHRFMRFLSSYSKHVESEQVYTKIYHTISEYLNQKNDDAILKTIKSLFLFSWELFLDKPIKIN